VTDGESEDRDCDEVLLHYQTLHQHSTQFTVLILVDSYLK